MQPGISIGSKHGKSLFVIIVVCVLASCGGGSSESAGNSSELGAVTVDSLMITVDSQPSSAYESFDELIVVDDLVVASSDVAFEVVSSGPAQCTLANYPMFRQGNVHALTIKPAAFEETLDLTCNGISQGRIALYASELGAVTVDLLTITVDSQSSSAYESFDELIVVDDLVVASSDVAFEVVSSGPARCVLANLPMFRQGNVHTLTIKPAYFEEILDLTCNGSSQGHIALHAEDLFIENSLTDYIENNIRVGIEGDDPYQGYRTTSYYNQIHRLIAAAELYTNADIYGIDESTLQKLENYLINTAEAFFEPCPDYDFYSGKSAQCRSLARVGKYYQWRSPNTAAFRVNHAEAEWRAAGGISQAVKALLLAYPPADDSSSCPASNEPSKIISASLSCRALNVRRLLYEEVWLKWNDRDWVASVGLDRTYTLQDADIAHYVAWSEYVVDLFDITLLAQPYTSRRDWLIEHFYDYGPYTGFSPMHPDEETRYTRWNGYQFGLTGSVDLGHTDTTIHLLTMYGEPKVCSKGRCAHFNRVAKTMSEQAWMAAAPEGGVAFPKFDVFMNGYCLTAYADPQDELSEFCQKYWLTEDGGWYSHRRLLGFVTLGKYDRDLMIKIRQSVNSGRKQELNSYIVFLYKTLKRES